MSLLRVPLVITTALAMGHSMTDPNPSVTTVERERYRHSFPVATLVTGTIKTLALLGGACETIVITAGHVPESSFARRVIAALVANTSLAVPTIRVTPTALVGWFLAVAGSYVRYRCFKTLGKYFTFELSIRKEHRLVTSGPYSYVRHPAYTGGMIAGLGTSVCFLGEGSWLRECGWLHTFIGKTVVGAFLFPVILGSLIAVRRTIVEDRTLQREFGVQWDEWAARVPYRLIPYVF
ncbi:ICMT-domain-containing protein [Heliocybe sulcata]|uniref:Protein-S-isoprenylcysteine O-methyltransferase n=1 Tax=Heliocybe sulcata TaxID=5364 RepID=A0A5C3MP92_9AGAM|nr:ICMT-domain-containing protein [Heliocybe sulcata]